MQPSIYHQDDEFEKDKYTVRIKDLQHHTETGEQIQDLKLTNKSNQSQPSFQNSKNKIDTQSQNIWDGHIQSNWIIKMNK